MCCFIGAPTVQKQTSRYEDSSGHHQGNTEFRSPHIVVPLLQSTIDAVIDGRADLSTQEEADTERNVI